MPLRTAAALALAAALLPAAGAAQGRGDLPKLSVIPASTRAMALGGAYQPTARHSDALFYNPALLAGATGMGVDLQRWGSAASATSASAALAWFGGSVAVGLQTLQAGVDGAVVPDHQDHLFAEGGTGVSERIVSAAYARRFLGVDWGVAGKLVEARVGAPRSTSALLDVGAARGIGPVVVGASVLDLGERPFRGGGDGFSPRLALGAGAYGQPVGPFDLGLAASVTHADAFTAVGGGVELGYWPVTGRTFLARVGAQRVPASSDASALTFGLAFWGDDLRLEWAYQGFGGGTPGTHRFGLAWH